MGLIPRFSRIKDASSVELGSIGHDSASPEQPAKGVDVETKPSISHDGQHIPWFRLWAFEVAMVLLSVAIVVAVVAVLAKYDGIEQPSWQYGVNLSTLLAILSTALRATLVLVAAEVISHAKWSWFESPRPMKHFQTFDNASRGVAGSIQLLFLSWRPHAGLFAALVIIISLTIGPFTQQTLSHYVCQVPWKGGIATVAASQYATDDVAFLGRDLIESVLNNKMKAAIINGLTGTTSQSTAVPYECSTGNCTFAAHQNITYSSVGFCQSCTDVRDQVERVETAQTTKTTGWLHQLPGGPSVAYGGGVPMNVSAERVYNSSSLDNSVLDLTFLSLTWATCKRNAMGILLCPDSYPKETGFIKADVAAARCSLYPCLRNYHGAISNGMLGEETVSTQRINTTSPPFATVKAPCLVGGQLYDALNFSRVPETPARNMTWAYLDGRNVTAPSECVYEMDRNIEAGIVDFLAQVLNGSCAVPSASSSAEPRNVSCGEQVWLTELYHAGDATLESLERALENTALAITNRLRSAGVDGDGDGANREHATRQGGVAVRTTLCTSVVWGWIALPALLTLSTAAILLVVVVRSRREEGARASWKASTLPLLFYGLRHEVDDAHHVKNLRHMESVSGRVKLQLVPGQGHLSPVVGGGESDTAQSTQSQTLLGRNGER